MAVKLISLTSWANTVLFSVIAPNAQFYYISSLIHMVLAELRSITTALLSSILNAINSAVFVALYIPILERKGSDCSSSLICLVTLCTSFEVIS